MKLCVGRLFQNCYKSILCQQDPYLAVKPLGMEGTVVGKRLGVSQSAISRAAERGKGLAAELSIALLEDKNA